jgi:hypothetical protein
MTEDNASGHFRFSVDPWDPAYGVAVDVEELDSSSAEVAVDIEVPANEWAPKRPEAEPCPTTILFLDGVRRVDAHIWIDGDDGIVHGGICASYSAGVVRCDGKARMADAAIGRGLFSASPHAVNLVTGAGTFQACVTTGALPAQLALALQEAMGRTEITVAERACARETSDLVVIDGPLRHRTHLGNAIGFVKTHHVAYLPPEQHQLVALLAPGERTPLFTLGTSWTRVSWYLRLPGGSGSPWAGIVRCECAAELSPRQAVALADAASLALPRFASEAHKDPRAPQNLYPIAALERELRRRLGDPQLVYRALRLAAFEGAE